MKIAVGRCPETGDPLASQPTISRMENSPSKTDAARAALAMVDQFCASVTPGEVEMFDIDDSFCAAHGGQQLAFWNAHELIRVQLPRNDGRPRCRPQHDRKRYHA
jgi:hypothetical protein